MMDYPYGTAHDWAFFLYRQGFSSFRNYVSLDRTDQHLAVTPQSWGDDLLLRKYHFTTARCFVQEGGGE